MSQATTKFRTDLASATSETCATPSPGRYRGQAIPVIALLVASLAAILAVVAIGINLSQPTPQIQPAVQQNLPAGGESAGGHVAINLYDCAGPAVSGRMSCR